MSGSSRQSGFSLIELVLVIALVGVLAGISVVGGQALWKRSKLSNAVSLVETKLEEARRLAKAQDRDILFELRQVDGVWSVIVDGRPSELEAVTLSRDVNITMNAPYGTLESAEDPISIDVSVQDIGASVHIVGVLAKAVIVR